MLCSAEAFALLPMEAPTHTESRHSSRGRSRTPLRGKYLRSPARPPRLREAEAGSGVRLGPQPLPRSPKMSAAPMAIPIPRPRPHPLPEPVAAGPRPPSSPPPAAITAAISGPPALPPPPKALPPLRPTPPKWPPPWPHGQPRPPPLESPALPPPPKAPPVHIMAELENDPGDGEVVVIYRPKARVGAGESKGSAETRILTVQQFWNQMHGPGSGWERRHNQRAANYQAALAAGQAPVRKVPGPVQVGQECLDRHRAAATGRTLMTHAF